MIDNIKELCQEIGCYHEDNDSDDDCIRRISKSLYKYSDCGICFNVMSNDSEVKNKHEGVAVAGYCEGVDWEFDSYELKFPFIADVFWYSVTKADKDGCEVWDETHGCNDCGWETEYGFIPINKECKTCEGDGIVI